MRIWHWVIAASLLLTLSANAQQSANSSSSPATAQTPASAAPPSTAMDQVVDRAIEREHALMEMLKTRTPLVETYLQNLKFDPQVGPAPVQDHYFLGRMDLSKSVDRRDYLSKGASFESHLLGGLTKLYKLEYEPMGFSWMIYADRDDFNRQIYDFKYVHREFLGDVRCF